MIATYIDIEASCVRVERDGRASFVPADPANADYAALLAAGVPIQPFLAPPPTADDDDSTPSLAITESKDGLTLVRCHAGCDQRAVIAALRERGLWGGGDASAHQARAPARAEDGAANEARKCRTARALQT